jgi:hypothetical protein
MYTNSYRGLFEFTRILSIGYFGVTYTVHRNRILIDIYQLCALHCNSIHTLVLGCNLNFHNTVSKLFQKV